MLHGILAVGIYVLPWRISAACLILLSLLAGIGAAVIVTAVLGWLSFLILCWRQA